MKPRLHGDQRQLSSLRGWIPNDMCLIQSYRWKHNQQSSCLLDSFKDKMAWVIPYISIFIGETRSKRNSFSQKLIQIYWIVLFRFCSAKIWRINNASEKWDRERAKTLKCSIFTLNCLENDRRWMVVPKHFYWKYNALRVSEWRWNVSVAYKYVDSTD